MQYRTVFFTPLYGIYSKYGKNYGGNKSSNWLTTTEGKQVQNEGTTTEGKQVGQSHMSGPIQSQNMMYCFFLWHFDICLFSIQLGHAKTCVGSQCSSSAKWALPSEMLCKRFFEGPAREIGCGGCGHLSHPHDKFPNPWTKQLVLFGFWGFPWCVCPTFFPGFYGQVNLNRTLPYGSGRFGEMMKSNRKQNGYEQKEIG